VMAIILIIVTKVKIGITISCNSEPKKTIINKIMLDEKVNFSFSLNSTMATQATTINEASNISASGNTEAKLHNRINGVKMNIAFLIPNTFFTIKNVKTQIKILSNARREQKITNALSISLLTIKETFIRK
jgi:hypothetical protein